MNGHIILPNVLTYSQTEKLLGKDWLKKKTEKAFKSGEIKANLHPGTMGQTFGTISHPLVYEEYDRVRYQGDKRGYIGTETPIRDYLEIDLKSLADIEIPKDMAKRLRDDELYDSARYELQIAAGFRRLEYEPVWQDNSPGKKPEFLARKSNGDIIAIECKRISSSGYYKNASKFWKHFQYGLYKLMTVESLNFWIKLIGNDFVLSDCDLLIQEIISCMKQNTMGHFNYINKKEYSVQYQKLSEPGGSIDSDIVNMYPRKDYGVNAGKYERNKIMSGPLHDPKLIRMELEVDNKCLIINSIHRNIKTASSQLSSELPNILYIDINIQDYTQEQEEIQDIIKTITSELANGYHNISVVVVTNVYPVLSLDNYIGIRFRTETVFHHNPINVLPDFLRFPGDTSNTMWIPGKFTGLMTQAKLDSEHTKKGRKYYGHKSSYLLPGKYR